MLRLAVKPNFLIKRFAATSRPKKSFLNQIQPFLKFARPEYKIVGGSLALLLISSSVTMSVPFSMGAIIDIVMERMDEQDSVSDESESTGTNQLVKSLLRSTGSLTGLFALLGGVFLVGAGANAGRQILMAKAAERVIARLRTALFSKLLKQDISFHDKYRSGELISRLSTDTTIVGRTLTSNIADGLRSLVMSSTGLFAMIYVNPQLTLSTMTLVPVISVIAVVYGRYVRKLAKNATDASADLTQFAEEKLSNVRTVRAFSKEEMEITKYEKKSNHLYSLGMKEGYASAFFFSSMGLSGNIVILAILYYGGSLVQSGMISIGELTSFFIYTMYVGSSLIGLSSWYAAMNKGVGASERLFSLMETPKTIEKRRDITPITLVGDIEFQNVCFSYPSRPEAQILKGLNFSLKKGETVAIVGHSGSGKSTIAQLLLRFYDPDFGDIKIDQISLKDFDLNYMRGELMGLVSQEPILFADTIMENIRYGNTKATDEEVIEAAKQANAHDFIISFPDGYKTSVGDRGHALSGGQKQRVAIARALLKNPKILILDEATSALDNSSEMLVQQALNRLIKGRTVITIAHRLSTIQKADRIFMIGKGKICESGTFDELIEKKGAFAALVGEIDED